MATRPSPPAAAHLRQPPFADITDGLPVPLFFRTEHMPAHATYPSLRHAWGEFVYSFSGVTEVKMGEQHFLAPPHLGLWIAPDTEHTGFNHQEAVHCSIYIRRDLCASMPAQSCALIVSPLLRAILDHLRACHATPGTGRAHARLLRVLADQIAACPRTGSFVPRTDDAQLEAILQVLRERPDDNRTLAELAADFHMSERTLMRRCQRELGMSLTQWRQRVRMINALSLLRNGRPVEAVALDMGYATSSAFIAMFRRLTGTSPGRFVAEKP